MNPAKVYLDTADWAYLQEGKAGGAASVLHELATSRSIVLLVSEEHLIEMAGLTHGRDERLTYIREFTGTYIHAVPSEFGFRIWRTADLLEIEARRLSEFAEGREVPAASVPRAVPLAAVAMGVLRRYVDEPGAFVRDEIYTPSADIVRDIRKAANARTRSDVEGNDKMVHAALTGDFGEVARLLMRAGKLPPEHAAGFEARMADFWPSIRPYLPAAEAEMANLMALDPVFLRGVVSYLPDALKADATTLARMNDIWAHKETRAVVVPSLAARAALIGALRYQPQSQYKDSEMSDQMHGAYAPLVDYFTCDRRNVDRITQALAPMGDDAPKIVRTKRLDELARSLGG